MQLLRIKPQLFRNKLLFRWDLQFIKSEFAGQLPKQYGKEPGATRMIPTHMNDRNLEEPTRYASDFLFMQIKDDFLN